MPSQTQRSEPQILADLIRLAHRKELEAEALADARRPEAGPCPMAKEVAAEAELIEQARAALHRHVVAEGKAYLSRPRAPLNLWTGACFAAGCIAVATAQIFGLPAWMPILGWALMLTGASIFIDRKHL